MPEQIEEKVISVVASIKRVPREAVSIRSTFEELGIDSLDGINILFELEGLFDISVPDEKARSIRSVQQIVDSVGKLVAEKASDTV
jgi:acyl carrier protein